MGDVMGVFIGLLPGIQIRFGDDFPGLCSGLFHFGVFGRHYRSDNRRTGLSERDAQHLAGSEFTGLEMVEVHDLLD